MLLIKADHKKLESLFKQYGKTSARDYKARKRLVSEMAEMLKAQIALNERTVYPPIQAKVNRRGREMILEAVEQQHIVKMTLGELSRMRPQDARFNAKVQVLMANVRRHNKFEESKIMPQAKKTLSSRSLKEMGKKMEAKNQPAKAAKAATKPASKRVTASVSKSTKPAAKRTVKSAAKPAAKRTMKTAAKPAAKRTVKVAAKPAAKRTMKSAAKPAAKRTVKRTSAKATRSSGAKPAGKRTVK